MTCSRIRREQARDLLKTSVAVLALLGSVVVHERAEAAELVPSVGLTKPVEGGGDTKTYMGLAVRGDVIPTAIQAELGAAYRREERFGGDLKVRMWPITTSLWLTPMQVLYAGAGVGWYHTTLDYRDDLPLEDETSSEFGVHVGGGLKIPLGPGVAADVNGRYVFMRDQESRLVPESFDPDFWTTTLGLALRL